MCLGCPLTNASTAPTLGFADWLDQDFSKLKTLEVEPLRPTLEAVEGFAPATGKEDKEGHDTDELESTVLVEAVARALLLSMADSPKIAGSEIFDCGTLPGITVDRYLRRLSRQFRCSNSAFIGALVILDRLLAMADRSTLAAGGSGHMRDDDETGSTRTSSEESFNDDLYLTENNVHRLFLTCLVIMTKFLEDRTWKNPDYARFGGVDVDDLNRYERYVFKSLDYRLDVEPELYKKYLTAVLRLSDLSEEDVQRLPSDPFERIAEERAKARKDTCCQAGISMFLSKLGQRRGSM